MRKIALLVLVVACVLAVGCKSKDQPSPMARDQWNQQRFANTSTLVSEGFMRDYPDATVTNLITYHAGSGRTVHRVDFIRDGQRDLATYSDTGRRISPPIPPITPY